MAITSFYNDYSKDQLIEELERLRLENEKLQVTCNQYVSEIHLIDKKHTDHTELLLSLNQYVIDIEDLAGEHLYKFIVNKFKELFKVRGVWISVYHDNPSELEIVASTATEDDTSTLIRFLGNSVTNFRTPVKSDDYDLIINTDFKYFNSLHELSFGNIPSVIGLAVEKLMGVEWFLGISLVDTGVLLGTMVIAGFKDQKELDTEIVSVFSKLSANILRRKQTEVKLHLSENKFTKAFYTSPDSININRLSDGKYVSINKGFTKITGFSEEEVIGKTSFELNIWANPKDREKMVKGLIENGEVENLEATFLMKDGSELYGIMSAAVLDLDGIPHVLSITRNITDRIEVEKALKKSESKYRELIELAVDGILIGSKDGTILSANSYMLALSGKSLNEIIGLHISDLFENECLEQTPLEFDLLKNGEIITRERYLLRPDKCTVPVEMHSKMMPDGTYQSIFHDISERKKSEKALRDSEEWFRSLFEQSTDGISYISMDGSLISVNKSFAEMHGYEIDEVINMKISDLDCPEALEFYNDRMLQLLNGEKLKFEVEHFHKKGHRIPIEVTSGTIKLNSETYILSSHRDITERKKSEERFLKLNECFLNFKNDPVHNINLLVAICGELTGATCSLYNRIEGGLLCSLGKWNTPPDFKTVDDPEGHLCTDVIKTAKDNTLVIRDLQNSSYAQTDPNVKKYKLSTYIGKPVKFEHENIGSLCLVFQNDFLPDENELRLLEIVSSAIGVEEERRHTLKALRESEEKFRSIAENLTDVIFITDLEGNVNYISPASHQFGYTPAECIGRYYGDFLADGEMEKAMNAFLEVVSSERISSNIEIHIRRKDGTEFKAELSGSVFKIGSEIRGVLGLVRDITQRELLESATIESEKRYRELFLYNPLPTYIFDVETLDFIETNDALSLKYGYSREEFSTMKLSDIRMSKDSSELIDSLIKIGENDFYSTSNFHRKKDGSVFPVEITSHPLLEKNGRKTRMVLVSDITEREKVSEQMNLAREKAEASDRLKTTFLNNISHEVRTPLNGILGFAEIMTMTELSREEIIETIPLLQESSNRLLETITNYMDISLLTSGNYTVKLRNFFPEVILRDIYENYKVRCSQKNLNLSVELPVSSERYIVNSDQEIFEKILRHLLNNALKFTERGSIELGLHRNENNITFFVHDSGPGIQKRSLDTIFERFEKVDQKDGKISEGSGLGLSIVKGLTELIGSKILVESGLGKGSVFSFSLPLFNAETLLFSEPVPQISFNISQKSTILIVEDDETNYFYLNALLKGEHQYKILHAWNGDEAVNLFKENTDICLILMDIKMPVMDGFEATRRIKLINKNIPIVAITAYAMTGDEDKILAVGCDGYLSKPISKNSLIKKISPFIRL